MGAVELNEVLTSCDFRPLDGAGAEDGDVGQRAADHGDLIAGIEAWAGLAVLVDLVGHGVALGDAEAEVLEEAGDAGEEADGHDLVVGGFGDQGFEDGVARAETAGLGLDDDGADLGEVRAVEMQRAAADELVFAFGVGYAGHGEVADVLADLGVAAAEEGAIAGKGVDEVEDGARVLQVCFVDGDEAEVVRR